MLLNIGDIFTNMATSTLGIYVKGTQSTLVRTESNHFTTTLLELEYLTLRFTHFPTFTWRWIYMIKVNANSIFVFRVLIYLSLACSQHSDLQLGVGNFLITDAFTLACTTPHYLLEIAIASARDDVTVWLVVSIYQSIILHAYWVVLLCIFIYTE